MKNPKITTIIPTYKRPKLLQKALTSIINQTYSNFEVHVCDNNSQDETETVVKDFIKKDPRIHYHCHEENIGMMANYKYGFSLVKAPFFSLLSDDDILFPWFYKETIKGLIEFPEVAMSASSTIIMSPHGEVKEVPLESRQKEGKISPPNSLFELIGKYPVPTCIIFRKDMINKIYIDESNSLVWDCDFLIQIAARYPIFISKKPCGIFLNHEQSFSTSQNIDTWKNSIFKLKNRIKLFNQISLEHKKIVCKLLENQLNNELKNASFASIKEYLFAKDIKKLKKSIANYRKKYNSNYKIFIISIIIFFYPFFRWNTNLLLWIRKLKKTFPLSKFSPYKKYKIWLTKY